MNTLKTLAAKVRVDVTYGARAEAQDDWQRSAHGYTVTLHCQRRRMTVDFWMGSANTSEPDALSVLECLLSDASSAGEDFDSWCGTSGYDTDSRKAERTYKQVQKQTEKLKQLLGSDFEAFLSAEQ